MNISRSGMRSLTVRWVPALLLTGAATTSAEGSGKRWDELVRGVGNDSFTVALLAVLVSSARGVPIVARRKWLAGLDMDAFPEVCYAMQKGDLQPKQRG